MPMPFPEDLVRISAKVDNALNSRLANIDAPEKVVRAMRHAALSGGKRLRPFLVIQCAGLFDVSSDLAMPVALALECLHTYSLIHDDLPAMDDDDLRRGQPTVHVEFDEATAILAGDGLQALAFEIITEAEQHYSASICCRLVHDLAHSAGVSGMVGGQILDLAFEKSVPDLSDIERMQAMKTGSLFRYACTCGVTIGGGSAEDRGRLENFANAFGLAFQITDDLLDEEASKEEMGKRTGKDSARGKATFVAHLGIEGARGAAQSKVEDALAALQSYGGEADNLRHLCSYLLTRRV